MKKKIYVKPCLEVIVIGDLCADPPHIEVASNTEVDAGESSAKQNNFGNEENKNDSVRNFNLWDEDE